MDGKMNKTNSSLYNQSQLQQPHVAEPDPTGQSLVPRTVLAENEMENRCLPYNSPKQLLPPPSRLMNFTYPHDILTTSQMDYDDYQELFASFFDFNRQQWNQQRVSPPVIFAQGASTAIYENVQMVLLESVGTLPPIIDEPYHYGHIAFQTAINGLYADGVPWCTAHTIMLALSINMSRAQRNAVIPLLIQGYVDAARESAIHIQAIQVTQGETLSIGGIATALIPRQLYLKYQHAEPGDILILTKPLGTTVALAFHRALNDNAYPEVRDQMFRTFSLIDAEIAKGRAVEIMYQSNLRASILARQFQAHAVCHIGSKGLLRHADLLARQQCLPVRFMINFLPIIRHMQHVSSILGCDHAFVRGGQCEISGGLFIVISRNMAKAYIEEFQKTIDHHAWVIGEVLSGNRDAAVFNPPFLIEYP